MSGVRVRAARPDDAAMLAEMANDLNAHVGIDRRPFTAGIVKRDGFGPDRAFTPQRRLRNCLVGMRAEPYEYGAPEMVDLELYLMWRARDDVRGAGGAPVTVRTAS